MTSWPGASTSIGGKTLKVLATRVGAAEGSLGSPGSVLEASGERIAIACGTGSLDLLRAQLEGKKPLGARDLISGRAAQKGQRLGD
jgi:methionyl-tRNA formyltransferase